MDETLRKPHRSQTRVSNSLLHPIFRPWFSELPATMMLINAYCHFTPRLTVPMDDFVEIVSTHGPVFEIHQKILPTAN